MSMRIMVLNGSNLNLLGEREPHIYGTTTLAAVEASCRELGRVIGADIAFHQSNHEGVVVDHIHAARKSADAIVINPAGFSFSSISVLDALKVFTGPVIEVHISNLHTRDELHRHSIISNVAKGVIGGCGTYGYILGIMAAAQMLGRLPDHLAPPLRVGPV
jgi:3-dehydroquinate dehydratase-2